MEIELFRFNSYFQKIFLKDNQIIDATCSCEWGKNNRLAFKKGDSLCKHLVHSIILICNRSKRYSKEEGQPKLSDSLKEELLKKFNYECKLCKTKDNLEIHRIKRGYQNGKYSKDNCIVLCSKCHDLIHYKEFR